MTPAEHVAEAEYAIRPVAQVLVAFRTGVAMQFNPLQVQIAIEYAKVQLLMAIAMRDAEVDTAVLDELAASMPVPEPPQPPAPPGGNGRLILPS